MELRIEKQQLMDELQAALKLSETKYQEAAGIYLVKLKEYVAYVEKQLRQHKPLVKTQPYFSMWSTQNLVNALDALKLHKDDTVIIDDRELTELKGGIQRLREQVAGSISTLSSTRY